MERAALPGVEGHHGGEEEAARGEGRGARRWRPRDRRADAAARAPAGQGRGARGGGGARAGAPATRGGQGRVSDVLAVLEQRCGALRKVSHEVVTGARRLADALGGNVEALVLAAGAVQGVERLGAFGADTVRTLTNAGFALYAPEGYTQVIAERAQAGRYGAVVFAASATGKDLAPRVAARLGRPLAQDVTDVGVEAGAVVVVRPVFAGKALLKLRVGGSPAVISLRPNVFTPVERPRAGVQAGAAVARSAGRVVPKEITPAGAGTPDGGAAPVAPSRA